MLSPFVSVLVAFLIAFIPLAATAAPLTDHPLLPRLAGFDVVESGSGDGFDAIELKDFHIKGRIEAKLPFSLQGRVTRRAYATRTPTRTNLQIYQNYETALLKAGAVQLNSGFTRSADEVRLGHHIFRLPAKAGQAPVHVLLYVNSPELYVLTVIEPAAAPQEIQVGELQDQLKSTGWATLYVEFDTGKSDLRPEAQGAIRAIVELMRQSAQLRISVDGHTDNVGDPVSNRKLSQARAQSVMAAVVAQGVPASRLSAKGFGPDVPIADNRLEAGRAKNRRVELMRQP
jgi:outer membrane protein OmpA-like peptidoglycan-associated protein